MFDIRLIRENKARALEGLSKKRVQISLDHIVELDEKKRKTQVRLDELRNLKNQANDEISRLLKDKKDSVDSARQRALEGSPSADS